MPDIVSDRIRDYVILVHLSACLRCLASTLEDHENIDEDDSWIAGGPPPIEPVRSPEVAIRRTKHVQAEIWRCELLAGMLGSADLKRPILVTLVECSEAICQADVPAEFALCNENGDEAILICSEAICRAWELCHADVSRCSALCSVEARILFSEGPRAEDVKDALGFDIDGFNLNTIPVIELADLAKRWHGSSAAVDSPGVTLSDRARTANLRSTGNGVGTVKFDVALSFPGEHRDYVADVAEGLRKHLGVNSVFYDQWYEALLARPNLDLVLQDIYRNSELVVVFCCEEYATKEWCGLEWRAIRELIKMRQYERVMPMRFDDTVMEGLFSIDGFIDLKQRSPLQVARLIMERLRAG
jgi:TIR domain